MEAATVPIGTTTAVPAIVMTIEAIATTVMATHIAADPTMVVTIGPATATITGRTITPITGRMGIMLPTRSSRRASTCILIFSLYRAHDGRKCSRLAVEIEEGVRFICPRSFVAAEEPLQFFPLEGGAVTEIDHEPPVAKGLERRQ